MGKSFKFISVVFLSCGLWGQVVLAQFDFSTSLGGRSYPKSAAVEAELGASYILWGNFTPETRDSEPWYGFVRAYTEAGLSVNYDSLKYGFEFFPISILGIRHYVKRSNHRDDFDAYDCVVYQCEFNMESQDLEVDLTLGYGSVFFGGRVGLQKLFELDDEYSLTPTVEPRTGLAWIPSENDEITYVSYFLGYQLSAVWQFMALYNVSELERTGDQSQSGYLFVNHQIGDFSVGVGAGAFNSELKEEKGSAVFQLKWEPLKSPVLF